MLAGSCRSQSKDQIFTRGYIFNSGVYIVRTLGRKKCPSKEVYSRPGEPWIGVAEVELHLEDKCKIGFKTRTNQTSNQLDMRKKRSGFVA